MIWAHIEWHIQKAAKKILSYFGVMFVDYPVFWKDKSRVHIGKRTRVSNTFFNTSSGDIFIGDNTMFSHNCMVLTGIHYLYWVGDVWIDNVPKTGRDIRIGERCWICSGSIILGGVTIGDESVIAAGAIVTKDVPPRSVIKGVH